VSWKVAWLGAAALIVAGCSGGHATPSAQTVKVGVLLHLTGPEQRDWKKALGWAADNVNAAGGVAGKRIQLVYRDAAGGRLDAAALALARDRSVVAVVGPQTAADVFRVAKTVVNSQTVLVTPSAGAGDLYRAFHTYPFFFRTVESDIAETRLLVHLAAQGGAKRVALLASGDIYGTTFFDWFGFFTDELGLDVTAEVRWDESSGACDLQVDAALRERPQVLVAASQSAPVTACIVRHMRAVGRGTRLLLTDSAEHQAVLDALGPAADGIEGVSPEAPPGNGFDAAFRARFGHDPSPYAANVYDALTLVAYGLQASHDEGGLSLARAMQDVVKGNGSATGWNAPGVRDAMASFRRGGHPDVEGAAGPLVFDKRSYSEPVSATYRHWIVRGGRFATVDTLETGALTLDPAASRRLERAHEHAGGTYRPGRRKSLWAVLVAGSSGWDNYRHQADVLAQYRLLRDRGVPDSHIVLVSADDLAHATENPQPGVVRYEPGGPNLNRAVHVDYHALTAARLLRILTGLPTTRNDDVYVFMAGHGNQNGFYLGLNGPIPRGGGGYTVVTPRALAATARKMRYRRLLIAVDSCQGGALGGKLDAPGAALISGAGPTEDSQSVNYDPELGTWLGDEFAFSLWHTASNHPGWNLAKAFETAYLQVQGSHVSLYAPRFGSLRHVTLGEFFRP